MLNFLSSNYPIFKPDQILRSSDLNNLRAYLELQDRATRAALIGAGVLCGLEVSCDAQTGVVTVSKGVGVSSDGFLFLFENDRRFRLSTKIDEIKLRKGELTGVFESVVGGSTQPESPEVSAFEFSDGKPTDKIDCEALTDFVFILACKQVETAGKKCFNGFDNAGSVGELETRLLAISKANYDALGLFKEDAGGSTSSLLTQFPCINRMPVCPPIGQSFPVYGYENLKNDWLTNISLALPGIHSALAEAVGAADADAWMVKMVAFRAAFSAQHLPSVAPLQYLHSHLRDLICAYDELAIARSRASSTYCYGDLDFAKYITLGPPCRMGWHRAGSDSSADADGQFAFLKNRLRRLLADPLHFGKPVDAANKQPVRISGSAAKSGPLDRQAIPYFYEESLRNDWNSALSAVNRQALVQQYEINQNVAFPRNALSKELSKYDFFRVEGHLGLELKTGFQVIEKLRADLNLPFELTCVRLGQQFLPNLPGELGHVTDQLVFDSFCRDHPGLDHLGGVPKGGTLVLVFVDVLAGNLAIDFQFNPNDPFHLFFLQNFGSRRIVADFCLPYSCFKAPMVEYKFEEICPPLADFEIFGQSWHAAFSTFFENENIKSTDFAKKLLDMPAETRPPVAKLILNDRSGEAILKKWFIQNQQISTGQELGDAGFVVLKSTGEENLTGYFRLDKLHEIAVARSVQLPPLPENRAEQQIDLCPHEMDLAIFDSEDKQDFGQEILLTNQVNAGAELHLHFSPPGGQWADNSPSNPKLFELSFMSDGIQSLVIKMPTDTWKPGSYFIRYFYPKGCGLEREVRLILPPPPQVQIVAPPVNVVAVNEEGAAAVVARPDVPRAVVNSRRAGYEKAIREDIPTAALRASPVFKNAESLLSIPFLPEKIAESLAAWKKTADAALKSIGRNGGADDGPLRLLVQNATWFLLDKLVVLHPGGLPGGAEKALSSVAVGMKKAGIDLNFFRKNWKADELRNPLTDRYLAIFE